MTLKDLLNNPNIDLDTEINVVIYDEGWFPSYYNVYVDTDISDKNIVYLLLDGKN
jgi:hypothetical protein